MNKYRSTRVGFVPKQDPFQSPSKITLVSNKSESINENLSSNVNPLVTSTHSFELQPLSSNRIIRISLNNEKPTRVNSALVPKNVQSTIKSTDRNDINLVKNSQERNDILHSSDSTPPKQNIEMNSVPTGNKYLRPLIIIMCIIGLFTLTSLCFDIYFLVRALETQTSTTTMSSTTLCWNTEGVTVAGTTGVSGSNNNELDTPYYVTLDSTDSIYIGDADNYRVQKYTQGATTGITVAGDGTQGTGLSQFRYPTGIVVDSARNLYVADTYNDRIQFWSVGSISGSTIVGMGIDDPFGLAHDPISNTLFISDANNHQVKSYISYPSILSTVAGTSSSGTNYTQLNNPRSIYYQASTASLIIANFGANNIVRWVLGDFRWTLVAGDPNGTSGNSSTLLNGPVGLTLDSDGNVYVADMNNHRIQFFSAGQSIGRTIAGVTGISGNSSTLLSIPLSVALDSHRNLYVADRGNQRIQKFLRC